METLSPTSRWYAYVSVDPDKLGGEPVFRGTRVPVRAQFDYLKDGYDIPTFLDHFRVVTREQVHGVLELKARSVSNRPHTA